MKAIDPGGDHGRAVVFAENQPEYLPLPARVTDDGLFEVTTRWQLTDEERLAVAAGGDLLLTQITFGHPLQPIRFRIAGMEAAGDGN